MKSKWLIVLIGICLLVGGCARSKDTEKFYFGPYSEAEKFYKKGKYAEAIAQYEKFIEANPKSNMAVIAEFYTAKSYEELGDIDKAKTIFKKISKEYPDLPWGGFSKAHLEELETKKITSKKAPVKVSLDQKPEGYQQKKKKKRFFFF